MPCPYQGVFTGDSCVEVTYQKRGPKEMRRRLHQEKDGAIMVEYALLIAGISVALMLAILAFSSAISNIFNTVAGLF